MMLCMVCSCNQPKYTPTNADESIEDSSEMAAQNTDTLTTDTLTDDEAYTNDETNEDASSEEKSLASKAYEIGYDYGISRSNVVALEFYISYNERELKSRYIDECQITLGKENYNNQALYNEYRRGFLKGYEDGKNALQ